MAEAQSATGSIPMRTVGTSRKGISHAGARPFGYPPGSLFGLVHHVTTPLLRYSLPNDDSLPAAHRNAVIAFVAQGINWADGPDCVLQHQDGIFFRTVPHRTALAWKDSIPVDTIDNWQRSALWETGSRKRTWTGS
jgi:hypothetical protein